MNQRILKRIITQALEEDRADKDITTLSLIPRGHRVAADIVAKENGVICGLDIAKKIFKKIDPRINVRILVRDGKKVKRGTRVMSLYGKSQTILSAERTALNFIGYLSGVATLTNQFVEKIKPYKTKIMDTRKTTPGLRELEKMAVRTGGGYNHRFHLQEMVLIKDNHRIAHRKLMSLSQAVTLVKKRVAQRVEVEVDNLQQFVEVLATKPDMILLDNMSVPQLKAAVRLRKKNKSHCLLEASGRIHLGNIRQIAQTGVDRISIGAITHSAVSIDFSMEFKP